MASIGGFTVKELLVIAVVAVVVIALVSRIAPVRKLVQGA